MRKGLLTAVAVAPLLGLFAGVADACPKAAGQATDGSDITMAQGCTVVPRANSAGLTLNSSNNITIDPGAVISNTNVSNSTGILVDAGGGTITGNLDNEGEIALLMNYVAPDQGNTGIAGGPFATGTDKVGIEVTDGTLTGNLTNDTGGSIRVQGNDSYGIYVTSSGEINGALTSNGPITMIGNSSTAVEIDGTVTGSVTLNSPISASGSSTTGSGLPGARGLVTTGNIGGGIVIDTTITTTGYRSNEAPSLEPSLIYELGKDQLEQGGSAVTVGGNVTGGVYLEAETTTTSTTTVAATTTEAGITTYGSAPAMVIGSDTQSITLTDVGGNVTTGSFGVVIAGQVTASGVYDTVSTPNLPGPVSATGIQLGDSETFDGNGNIASYSGTTTDLTGGLYNSGAVTVTALDATATGIRVEAGTTAAEIQNDGTISATVTASQGESVYGIRIDGDNAAGATGAATPNASIGNIDNTGVIEALLEPTTPKGAASASNSATAIYDGSGSLTSITNSGQITAAITPNDLNYTIGGTRTAIDVSSNTTGVKIDQEVSQGYDGQKPASFTGSIANGILTVSSISSSSGQLEVGETIYGLGVPNSNNSGVTTTTYITGEITGTGGKGTYTVNTIADIGAEDMTASGATPSITGNIAFGSGANTLDVEAGLVTGEVTQKKGGTLALTVGNQTTEINADVDLTNPSGAAGPGTAPPTLQLSSLSLYAGGNLTAEVDPSYAIGASPTPTPVFNVTGAGNVSFEGGHIGIALDSLQTARSAEYEFVNMAGTGTLTVGNLDQTALSSAPYMYQATTTSSASQVDVTLTLKTPQQLGLNASGAAAFNAVFQALQKNAALGDAMVTPTTKYGFLQLYNQMLPDQGIGTFESLEAATEKIASLTEQSPDPNARIAGTSVWLQEVNETIKRDDGETLGVTDKTFGLVGGYEKMGPGGGAIGVTLAYLNIGDEGTFEPIGGDNVANLAEIGAYYRREWKGLRFSVRAGGGYAWFNQRREFVTTAVNETAYGNTNGYFADAHAGLQYEQHFGSFYVRPELSVDYLYLNEDAYNDSGAGPGFDLSIADRASGRMTSAALITVGTQYGHDTWFRPEVYGGYRTVVFGDIADTVAQFQGGSPFSLAPGDVNGGWLVAGFALKAGTPLSYIAIEGEMDLGDNEQRYDLYLSGRALF